MGMLEGLKPNPNYVNNTLPQQNATGYSSVGGANLFLKPQEQEEQENKNSTLGVLGRTLFTLPQSIGKGLTSELDKIADMPAHVRNVIAQNDAKVLKDFASQQEAERQEARSKQATDTHLLGSGIKDWETKVDERQQAILDDNPSSRMAKAGYYANELVGEGVGRMLPTIAAATLTGGAMSAASGGAAMLNARADLGLKTAVETLKTIKSVSSATGLGTMFMGVYSNSYDDSVKNGADYSMAGKKAMLDGVAEVVTEMMFGGIAGLGEGYINKAVKSLSSSNITEALAKATGIKKAGLLLAGTIKSVSDAAGSPGLKGFLFDALGEGAEEMVAEFIGPYIERATTNPYANSATMAEILQAGLGGALLSFAMKPFGSIQNRIMGTTTDKVQEARLKFRTTDFNQVANELHNFAINGITDTESKDVAENILGTNLDVKEFNNGAWIVQPMTRGSRIRALENAEAEARANGADKGNRQAFDTYLERASQLFEEDSNDKMEAAAAKHFEVWFTEKTAESSKAYQKSLKAFDEVTEKVRAAELRLSEAEANNESEESKNKLREELEGLNKARVEAAQERQARINEIKESVNRNMTEDRILRMGGGEDMVENFRAYNRVLHWQSGDALFTGSDGLQHSFNRFTRAEDKGGRYFNAQEREYFKNHPEAVKAMDEEAEIMDAYAEGRVAPMTEEQEAAQAQAFSESTSRLDMEMDGVSPITEEEAAQMQADIGMAETESMSSEDAEQAPSMFAEEEPAPESAVESDYTPDRLLDMTEDDIRISEEVDAEFEQYNQEVQKELLDFADKANKALEERGFKGKLSIKVDIYDTKDTGSYGNGVIQLSPSRIHSAEGAKFVLAHEMLHAIRDKLMTREQFDAFGETVKQAMAAMGFNMANTFDAVYPTYRNRHIDWVEKEADAKKLTGEEREKYIDEEIERACLEEVYARFMSVAFGSDGLLQSLSMVNPQLLMQMRDEVEHSAIANLPKTIWDFTRLQILNRIEKAIASPVDPEDVADELEADRRMLMAELSDDYTIDENTHTYSKLERLINGMTLGEFKWAFESEENFRKALMRSRVGRVIEEWDDGGFAEKLNELRSEVDAGKKTIAFAKDELAKFAASKLGVLEEFVEKHNPGTGWNTQKYTYNNRDASDYRVYRHVMPGNTFSNDISKQHFGDEKGIVAFTRNDVRKDREGRTVFFVQENQSDLHSAARKGVYKSEATENTPVEKIVDDAPYKKDRGQAYAFAEALARCHEEGIDLFAWTPAWMQADRYKQSVKDFAPEYDKYLMDVAKRLCNELGGKLTTIQIARDFTVERIFDGTIELANMYTRENGLKPAHAYIVAESELSKDEASGSTKKSSYEERLTDEEKEFLADLEAAKAATGSLDDWGRALYKKFPKKYSEYNPKYRGTLFDYNNPNDVKRGYDYVEVPAIEITPELKENIEKRGMPSYPFMPLGDEDFVGPVDHMYSKAAKVVAGMSEKELTWALDGDENNEFFLEKYLSKKGVNKDELKFTGFMAKVRELKEQLDNQEITLSNARDELLDYAKVAGALMETELSGSATRHGVYQLPAEADDYREYLYSVPNSDFQPNKRHYDKGVLAWIRTNIRETLNGEKVFFAEEAQSDWHNQGISNGYYETREEAEANKKEVDALVAKSKKDAAQSREEYLSKRNELIARAQARVTADPSAYSKLNSLMTRGAMRGVLAKKSSTDARPEVQRALGDMLGWYALFFYQENGNAVSRYGDYNVSDFVNFFTDNELSDFIDSYYKYQDANNKAMQFEKSPPYKAEAAPYSKDAAERYMSLRALMHAVESGADWFAWTTANMQAKRWSDKYNKAYTLEYDQRFVKFLNNFAKDFGSKVEDIEISAANPIDRESASRPHAMDFLDQIIAQQRGLVDKGSKKFYDKYVNDNGNYTVHAVRITPEMRESITKGGTPRFPFMDLGSEEFWQSAERAEEYTSKAGKYGTYDNGTLRRINQHVGVSQTVDRLIGNANTRSDQLRLNLMMSVLEGKQGLTHIIMSDDNARAHALQRINAHRTLGAAYTEAMETLKPTKVINKYDIAFGEQLIVDMADRINDIENGKDLRANESKDTTQLFDQMQQLIANLCAAGTRAGQNLQAFRLLKHMTGTGRLYYIEAQMQQYISEIYDRKGYSMVGGYQFLRDSKGNVLRDQNGNPMRLKIRDDLRAKMESARSKEEMDRIEEEILDDIASKIPPTLTDRVVAWRYLAMLGNPRTHIRNMVSNFAMGVAVNAKNRVGGVLEDIFLKDRDAIGRTKTNQKIDPALRDALRKFADNDWTRDDVSDTALSGGKVGFQSRIEERRNKLGFKDFNFLDKVDKWNSRMLETEDYTAARRAYRNAFVSYCAANNLTPEYLSSRTTESNTRLAQARSYAVDQAAKATYHDANALATHLNQIEKMNSVSKVIVGGLVPFKKTPANILKRGIEYSPISIVSGIKQFRDAKALNTQDFIDARMGEYNAAPKLVEENGKTKMVSGAENALSIKQTSWQGHKVSEADLRYSAEATKTKLMADALDKLASGLTGTMIVMLGMLLGHWGLMKGSGDENKREEYYDQMLGNQEYSIDMFGKNFTLDWLTPVSMPLFTGVELMKMIDGDGELSFNEALDAVGRLADPVMNLSVLQGINQAMSSYDSGLGKMVLSAGESYIGQFIPTLAGQIARSIDPVRRTTYAAKEGEGLGGDLEKFRNKLENKIPFLNSSNSAYVDMWGRQDVDTDPFVVRLFKNSVLPMYIKDNNKTQADDYITQLFTATGERSVIPNTPESSYTFDGERFYLLSDEYQFTKEVVGQISNIGVTSLMNVPGFFDLSPAEQASYVEDVYSFARAVAKKEYADSNGITSYDENGTNERIRAGVNAGLSIGEAVYIYHTANKFTADKDANGNSINGSKKNKMLNFYHSLGLTEEQIKAIIPSSYKYP